MGHDDQIGDHNSSRWVDDTSSLLSELICTCHLQAFDITDSPKGAVQDGTYMIVAVYFSEG